MRALASVSARCSALSARCSAFRLARDSLPTRCSNTCIFCSASCRARASRSARSALRSARCSCSAGVGRSFPVSGSRRRSSRQRPSVARHLTRRSNCSNSLRIAPVLARFQLPPAAPLQPLPHQPTTRLRRHSAALRVVSEVLPRTHPTVRLPLIRSVLQVRRNRQHLQHEIGRPAFLPDPERLTQAGRMRREATLPSGGEGELHRFGVFGGTMPIARQAVIVGVAIHIASVSAGQSSGTPGALGSMSLDPEIDQNESIGFAGSGASIFSMLARAECALSQSQLR